MTNPYNQPPSYGPPGPAPGPQPPQKSHTLRTVLIVLAIVIGLPLLLFVGCAALIAESDPGGGGKPIGAAATDGTQAPAAEATEEAAPELTADDVKLRVKTLDKQCFGSAGCNVTYRVEVKGVAADIPADASYEVSYEVRGPESGAEVGTLTITGDEYEVPMENFTMTRSSGVKLKAKVTEIVTE